MKKLVAISSVMLLAGCGSSPQPAATTTPSVLVEAVRPQRGSLPQTVPAYGTVAPALNGTQTFSEAQPGQVTRLMVAPGSAVRAGQPLAVFTMAPASRSTYQQATDALAAAQKQRATTTQLLAQQLATQDQMVQADRAVTDAQAALAALRADGAGQNVHTLTAPFNGVVTTVAVAQGDRTQPGAPILTVARSTGIVVTSGVDPSQRAQVSVGQTATLQRLTGGAALTGRVIRVDSALNPRTRMIDVDMSFSAGALIPGEAMQAAIETGKITGWVMPHAAVVTAGGASHIFQVAGGKAVSVPVKILLASDHGDVVAGNIAADRPLIVTGAYQVNDGDAVRLGK